MPTRALVEEPATPDALATAGELTNVARRPSLREPGTPRVAGKLLHCHIKVTTMAGVSQLSRGSDVEELANAIRKAIQNGETSVVKLSESTGISRMQIYRIMDGDNAPSLSNAEKLAKEIGLTISLQRG